MRKKRAWLCATALLMFGGVNFAWAADYKIDPEHSFIVFKIPHLGISTLVGQFPGISGQLSYDAKELSKSKVTATVKMESLDSNHAERDKHLAGKDFLNAKEYPVATFNSTQFEGDKDGGLLKGDLTFMGKTKPISIQMKKVGEGKDPWGGERIGFEGSTSVSREAFGITYNLGPNTDAVRVELYVEAIKL